MKFFTLILFSIFGLYASASTDKARLIASKKVLNTYLVEGQDILVEFALYNMGTAPALNVQLTDSSFGSESFELVAGKTQVKFDRIAPSANVSHSFVVRPMQFGYFNFTAAEVSYLPSEESQDIQVGYTSAPGEGGILPLHEYNRRFSSHVLDWLLFCCLLLPVLAVPYLMWNNFLTKYPLQSAKTK